MPVGNRLLFSHDRQGKTRKILALSFCAGSIPPLLWFTQSVRLSPLRNPPLKFGCDPALSGVCGMSACLTTLVAAVLHDAVEDTGTTPAGVEALFGAEVTDDKSLPDRSQTGSAGLMISGSEKSILYTAYCS